MEMKSRVYALIDEQNRVKRIEGQYSLPQNLDGWTLIEEGEPCDRLNLAQNQYLGKSLMDERGLCRYKWNGKKIVERKQSEIDADYVEPVEVPSQLDRIEAQVFWTGLMTDTLIEGD